MDQFLCVDPPAVYDQFDFRLSLPIIDENISAKGQKMILVKNGLILFVAIQHIAFLVLEMFFWTKPVGLKIFRQSLENAQVSAVLAANQGLYNGFLAAGLIWSLMHPDILFAKQLAVFFLACVICAGAYGAYTVNLRLFFVQGLPAMIALAAVLILA